MCCLDTIIFPMRFSVHVAFAVISLILLLILYKRYKYFYHILLIIGIASTFAVYFCGNDLMLSLLGIEELIILCWIIVDMIKVSRKKLKAEKPVEKQKKPTDGEVNEDSNS